MDIDQRLNRIEEKLDSVSEMLGTLGRIEERAAGLETRVNRHEFRIDLVEGLQREQAMELSKHAWKGSRLGTCCMDCAGSCHGCSRAIFFSGGKKKTAPQCHLIYRGEREVV